MYLEKFRLDGRTAFVTGGARGIGLCTAEALGEAGARVIVSDLAADAVEEAVTSLRAKGVQADGLMLDVTDPLACREAAALSNESWGPVDVLVANAGIAMPDTPAEAIADEAWRLMLDVNLNGVFWCCREFGRFMVERGRGAIVATGSMSGFIANKPQRQAHYNASKAAVHHLIRSLAAEWAPHGVRVNAVAPTYVNTAMTRTTAEDPAFLKPWLDGTPMGRMVEPEEVAALNLFLASDASSGMTGTVALVDAGYTIW